MISRRSPSPPKPSVVTRGLIEHFDFADGKGTETTLKSRLSDNVLTLTNFNFDVNSGWTGKGLRFDGIDDAYAIETLKSAKTIIFTVNKVASKKSYIFDNRHDITQYFLWWSNNVIERGGLSKFKTLGGDGSFVGGRSSVFVEATNSFSFIKGRPNSDNSAWFLGDFYSILVYDVVLTEEELFKIYEYEQSIDRTTASAYPMLQEQKSYGIGLSNQLSEEQKTTFRLSVDGTKFVAGLRYCEGLEVEEFTYSEIQKEMEKEEWSKIEEV